MITTREFAIHLNRPHARQDEFIKHPAKRKMVRAGRRGGKTEGMAIYAVQRFLDFRRILYAVPTADQMGRFWSSVKNALREPIEAGILYVNNTEHIIELPGTETRIRAKTAFNADTLRGDYADELILDEFQLMSEDAWDAVGAPMLLDNNGNAIFIYTPPSLRSRSASKARDPMHAAKMFKRARQDTSGRWATFHFSSMDNPYISKDALADITSDMSAIAYRQEILAEDVEESPGALWTREIIEVGRVLRAPELDRVVVAIDPSATSTGDEAGIITAGRNADHFYCLADDSIQGSPETWGRAAVTAYHRALADCIVAEANNGGEMISLIIRNIDPRVPVKLVHASRGKQTRAEPVSVIYEQKRGHHVGSFPALEDELSLWVPGDQSPNRLDALVWAGTELMLQPAKDVTSGDFAVADYRG